MNRQSIFCKTLLQGEQWRNDVVLELDQDGIIISIEPGAQKTADQHINGVVVPGMPNAHSHAFQRLIAGFTGRQGEQRDSFWSWREAMYQCAGRITPEQFADVAAWVFVEMLKAGYTTCTEFQYIHHQPDGHPYGNLAEMSERLVEAAELSGISMTLLPVLYSSAGFGRARHENEQRRFVNSPDRYLQLLGKCREMLARHPLMALGLAPHSLRAVPRSVLNEVLQAWPDQECPVHIHIAEQLAEVDSCIAHTGARPVEWLLDQFPVNERWSLVHATHLSSDEVKNAASRRAIAGLCPTTEADLGDGIFRTTDWLRAGGQFSIGSDSNVRVSVTEELRLLEYNERLSSGQRNVLAGPNSSCGSFLYQHTARAGGVASGQPVGALEPGHRADLLELDGEHVMLAGRDPDVSMDSWIFAGDRSMINSVWVAGRRLVNQGHHAREDRLRTKFSEVLTRLQML